jgi:hypothetical protein
MQTMRIAHVLTLAAAAAVSVCASADDGISSATGTAAASTTVPVAARSIYKMNRLDYQRTGIGQRSARLITCGPPKRPAW